MSDDVLHKTSDLVKNVFKLKNQKNQKKKNRHFLFFNSLAYLSKL